MTRTALVLAGGLWVLLGGETVHFISRDMRAVALHVLDVGQGDAILVRSGRADILIDGGPDTTVLRRLGEVRPFWDRRLEVIVLTHPQQDHLRGLLDVLEREKVGLVVLPEIPATSRTFRVFVARLRERKIPVRAARAGQTITVGALRLTVLAPDATVLGRAAKNPNAGSVVLRGDAPSFSFLLTGDIEAPTERHLLTHARGALDADVLKVPHHGSKTSSTRSFLRAVRPRLSVVSVGARNRYGHPHEQVVARFPPVALLRTDLRGTISLLARSDGRLTLRCALGCLGLSP